MYKGWKSVLIGVICGFTILLLLAACVMRLNTTPAPPPTPPITPTPKLVAIKLTTSIGAGTRIIVNGEPKDVPHELRVPPETEIELDIEEFQHPSPDVRYRFLDWSDGEARKHKVRPTGDVSYEAQMAVQYKLTLNAGHGQCSVSPPSSDGFYDKDTSLSISCSPVISFTPTGSMGTIRGAATNFTLTRLCDGRVLTAGGFNNNRALASAELYDPATETWTPTGSMVTPRDGHSATLLANCQVLVAGGGEGTKLVNSAELYDPISGTWSATGSFSEARHGHTAVRLHNGKVLIAAGIVHGPGDSFGIASAELYDPASGRWSSTGSLKTARMGQVGVLLSDGSVLIAGGMPRGVTVEDFSSAEVYDPVSETWSNTGSMAIGRRQAFTLTRLADGKVLVAGGTINWMAVATAQAEVYNPATAVWTPTSPTAATRRAHSATLLLDGRVLVAGGDEYPQGSKVGTVVNTALVYDPVAQTWSTITNTLGEARRGHHAVRLSDGRVLVVGGSNGILALSTAELAIGLQFSHWEGDLTGAVMPGMIQMNSAKTVAAIYKGPPSQALIGTISVGNTPAGVAVKPVSGRVYVVNGEGGTVSVIDGETNRVLATLSVGAKPRYIAANPTTNRLYVTHYFAKHLTMIDGATNEIIGTVALDGNPTGVEVNPNTNRIYVASIADNTQGGTFAGVSVIDGASNTVIATVTVGNQTPSSAGPGNVAVNPITNLIYVGSNNPNSVSVIDGAANRVAATIEVDSVDGIGVNPTTNRIYAANPAGSNVLIIDGTPGSPTQHTVFASVGVGRVPSGVDVNPHTNRIYVANAPDRTISIIDGANNRVVATVPLAVTAGIIGADDGLAVDPTTHRVYISHQQANVVSVVID